MIAALTRRPVAAVVLAVMAVHSAWIAVYVASGHEARDFIHIGRYWVEHSHASSHIVVDPSYSYPGSRDNLIGAQRGYDGQFYYFIALDPREARHYIDSPSYRYDRILYPMASRALAFGNDSWLPYTMVVVNWFAIALGTLAVALLLRRYGASSWWAAIYGLAPGMLLCLQRDLTEPLAYALAAGGLLALSYRRTAVGGVAFALSALTRQTTLLITFAWAFALWLGWIDGDQPRAKRRRRALGLTVLSAVPYWLWSRFVSQWLVNTPNPEPYVKVPFKWLFAHAFSPARQPPMVLCVVVPALLLAAVAITALMRGERRPEWLALLIQVIAFVVFAPAFNAYTSLGRVVLGIVLIAVVAVPLVLRLAQPWRRVAAVTAVLYLVMTPVVFAYGLTNFQV